MVKASPSPPDELDRLEQLARAQGDLVRGLRFLRDSPDWQVLRQAMLAARRKVMEKYTEQLLKGLELNQRQLDYDRGYWDGIIQVLEQPWRASEAFEKTIERLERAADSSKRRGSA